MYLSCSHILMMMGTTLMKNHYYIPAKSYIRFVQLCSVAKHYFTVVSFKMLLLQRYHHTIHHKALCSLHSMVTWISYFALNCQLYLIVSVSTSTYMLKLRINPDQTSCQHQIWIQISINPLCLLCVTDLDHAIAN